MKKSCGQVILILLATLSCALSVYIAPGPRYVCPEKAQSIFPCKCLRGSDVGLYVRCENTNLASLSIGLNNVAASETPIEELVLHRCHIKNLYGSLFYRTVGRVLRIEDTPIETIDEHVFHGINSTLQELHIVNSSMQLFPAAALKILGNLTVLNFDQHQIASADKDIFADSMVAGRLEKLHLTNGQVGDFPMEAFTPLRKLKTLDLHGNRIASLKRNQFKNMRDVEVLDLSHNALAKLDSSHIADLTKLSWCNVSHNSLAELTRGTFARNSVLRVLNMAHNQIKRLDANSFRGMRFMRRLYLNDNQLSDIGRGTFGAMTRIGTIDLARNKISKIDYQMFAQLNYVEILNLAENQITEIQKQSFKDLYQTVINISHNAIATLENDAFENCANITLLDLSYNRIENIPKYTFDTTSYAYELQLSYNQLTNLSQVPLHNMTGLRVLNVSHNALTTIPRNTFPKLYELHTIDVSHNNISSIANAVFQTLFSLRNLDLSYNALQTIKPPTFGTLPTLLELNLNNNGLNNMAKGALVKLASLRELRLENNELEHLFEIPISLNYLFMRNNSIAEIPLKTWPSMNAMLYLDLSDNRLGDSLTSSAEETFRGLLTLQTLKLNNNGITQVPHRCLSVLSTLQYLYFEHNALTELNKKAFGNLPVVFELHMFNNTIDTVNPHAFDGLLQLITLNMSSNALRAIPNEAFAGLVSLRILDLSHNQLEKLDNRTHGLLDDCLSLETINLSHNRFSFITRKMFPSNIYIPYKLTNVDLSYNLMPVLTFDLTFGTRKVRHLNLSHNSINDIRRGVLGNLTSVETLDLSFNMLEDLAAEPNIFNLPTNISSVYLNNNQLRRIPVAPLEKAANLSVLDLRGNELESLAVQLITKVTRDNVSLYFEGNPLHCDCRIRPLTQYLRTLTEAPDYYRAVKCSSPTLFEGMRLVETQDEYYGCDLQDDVSGMRNGSLESFDRQPDLKFRDVLYTKDYLYATWFVSAPYKDIADTYVNVRDAHNNAVLLERHLAYDTRQVKLAGSDLQSDGALQLCVQAKNSDGSIGTWFDAQCYPLPTDFASVRRKYTDRFNGVFTMLSSKPARGSKAGKRRGSTSAAAATRIQSLQLILMGALAVYAVQKSCGFLCVNSRMNFVNNSYAHVLSNFGYISSWRPQ